MAPAPRPPTGAGEPARALRGGNSGDAGDAPGRVCGLTVAARLREGGRQTGARAAGAGSAKRRGGS